MTDYYLTHGIMSDPRKYKNMLEPAPRDLAAIVKLVQNFFVHQHCAPMYGYQIPGERLKEPWLRSFQEKLKFLFVRGNSNLHKPLPIEERMVAICRDFAVVSAALCREAGIPARARCGFAEYLEPGKWDDHWVLEYWNAVQERWVRADTQLDEVQREVMGIDFDSLDVGERFLTGPEAWKLCRGGGADPQLFGIFRWWGYGYLMCNMLLDANSLLKDPYQPWDIWPGYKQSSPDQWSDGDYAALDALADWGLRVDEDFKGFREFMESHAEFRVPLDRSLIVNHLEQAK